MGARAHGLANASTCLSDPWSFSTNVAGIAKTKLPTAGFSYHVIPSFMSFNRMAAVFAMPTKGGVAAASAFRFGDDLYNEQMLSGGFANTFGLASLGLKMNYIQYRAQGLQARHAFTVSFGGIASLTETLSFGASIININQPVIDDLTGERIPTLLMAGLAFTPSAKLFVTTEIEKDMEYPATWKSGLEYVVLKKVAFRTGFNLHPQAGFFGLGFKSRKFDLDYSMQLSDPYGLSHQATATYQLKVP